MFRDDEEDELELNVEGLSPLAQILEPKVLLCRIREYHTDDLEACQEIFQSVHPTGVKPEAHHAYSEFLRLGTSYYLVIEHEGDIVACGGLELVGDSDSATLVHFMVHGDYQRRGYGTTLLIACLALLDQEDRPFDLWVNASRDTAPFFRQYSFRQHPASPESTQPDKQALPLWISVDPQDIADARTILEDRNIRIDLARIDDQDDDEDDDWEETSPSATYRRAQTHAQSEEEEEY